MTSTTTTNTPIIGKYEPCPFCGSNDVMSAFLPGFMWITGCNNCGCRTKEFVSSFEAVSAWNRRLDHEPDSDLSPDTKSTADILGGMGLISAEGVPF